MDRRDAWGTAAALVALLLLLAVLVVLAARGSQEELAEVDPYEDYVSACEAEHRAHCAGECEP
ncbi:MAG: hypothetical protein Q8Q14_03505 [Gemmatimonadales bacterium]|nr:hypothetical protein [Gemmatimonadales bacterium]